MGQATNLQFCMHIYRLNRNKSPSRISGKVAVGVVRDTRKFSGHQYIGRIARSALRNSSAFVFLLFYRELNLEHHTANCHKVSYAELPTCSILVICMLVKLLVLFVISCYCDTTK